MSIIEDVKAGLAQYPEVQFVEAETTLTIPAADNDGFAILVMQLGSVITVVYGEGWNEQFTDPAEAVQCIIFGLSPACRLVTAYRGSSPYRWTVEYLEDGEWLEFTAEKYFSLAFWRPKKVVYRQNRVLAWPPPH